MGRTFLRIDILREKLRGVQYHDVGLKFHVKLDIQGNELESVDARFYEQNKSKPESAKIKNFRHIYSMAGLFKSTSVDAGETWNLANIAGSQVYSWDSRGSSTHTEYDRLQRPIKIKVTNQKLNLNNIVEKFFYSENTQDKATNRYGTLIAHYDQAGLTKVEENDFKGQPLKSSYLLRKNYKQEADWKSVESITTTHTDLEQEVFSSNMKYNAVTDPQNNIHIPVYDIAGRVKQIKLKKSKDPVKIYVSDISYNPKGQRISITYGNGVITNYSYDPKTFRLTKLESVKGQKKLQGINYTYDPVGNITRMNDDSYKVIFSNNKNVDTNSDYHYDSLYRLSQATGKEHPALSGKEEIITPIPHLNNQNAISNYTEYYDFDYGSNITKIRHVGENSSTKEFYISNKSNRSLPIVDNVVVNESDIDSNYDDSGNLLKLNGTKKLHWNYRDNIAYVDIITRTSGKNDSEYYVYDSSRQRVRKVTETYQNDESNHTKIDKIYFGDIEVTRTYQDNNLNKEKNTVHVMDDKSRVALHQYWSKGSPESGEIKNQDRYQLSNHLDSVALELNDSAEIITYEEYLPFGGTVLIAGRTAREVTEKEYRYSGKDRDNSTGLYYYGARYYAPWLARWINPDPAGTVDGLNLYLFVRGNPINSIDLFGFTDRTFNVNLSRDNDSLRSFNDLSFFPREERGREDTKEREKEAIQKKAEAQKEYSIGQHIKDRIVRFFGTPGLLSRIGKNNEIDPSKIIMAGRSTSQDASSGMGEKFQSAHIIQAQITDEARKGLKASDLIELNDFISHTQVLEKHSKVDEIGAFIDDIQENTMKNDSKFFNMDFENSQNKNNTIAQIENTINPLIEKVNNEIDNQTNKINKFQNQINTKKEQKENEKMITPKGEFILTEGKKKKLSTEISALQDNLNSTAIFLEHLNITLTILSNNNIANDIYTRGQRHYNGPMLYYP